MDIVADKAEGRFFAVNAERQRSKRPDVGDHAIHMASKDSFPFLKFLTWIHAWTKTPYPGQEGGPWGQMADREGG